MAAATTEVRALARDLKRVRAVLRRETAAALRRMARSSFPVAKQSAQATLPRGGGRGARQSRMVVTERVVINGQTYARRRARPGALKPGESPAKAATLARYRAAKVSTNGRGVTKYRVTALPRPGKKIDLQSLDRGRLRHPLFGNRRYWYMQAVRPGWFTSAVEGHVNATGEGELNVAVDKTVDSLR